MSISMSMSLAIPLPAHTSLSLLPMAGSMPRVHVASPGTVIDLAARPRATVAIRDIMPGVQADLDALGHVIRLRVLDGSAPDTPPTGWNG